MRIVCLDPRSPHRQDVEEKAASMRQLGGSALLFLLRALSYKGVWPDSHKFLRFCKGRHDPPNQFLLPQVQLFGKKTSLQTSGCVLWRSWSAWSVVKFKPSIGIYLGDLEQWVVWR